MYMYLHALGWDAKELICTIPSALFLVGQSVKSQRAYVARNGCVASSPAKSEPNACWESPSGKKYRETHLPHCPIPARGLGVAWAEHGRKP